MDATDETRKFFTTDEGMNRFVSDECLRCGRGFMDGDLLYLVVGSESAKYRDIAIEVCRGCVNMTYDSVAGLIKSAYPPGGNNAPFTAPRYVGFHVLQGFAKMSRTDTGHWRVGLHRGHVEVWTAEQVETTGKWAQAHVGDQAYSEHFQLYSSVATFKESNPIHREVEILFIDLTQPENPNRLSPPEDHPLLKESDIRAVNYYPRDLTALSAYALWQSVIDHVMQDPTQAAQLACWEACSEDTASQKIYDLVRDTMPSIVLWQQKLWDAATRGAESFHGTVLQEEYFPEKPQIWLWPQPKLYHYGELGLDVPCVLAGFILAKTVGIKSADAVRTAYQQGFVPHEELSGRKGLRLGLIFLPVTINDPFDVMPRFRFLPSLFDGEMTTIHAESLAGLAFLRLQLVECEPVLLPRPERRRLERANRPIPELSVVVLRRVTARPGILIDNQPSSVDWSCQWMVTGHWRRQWYAKLQEHRPRYIEPYVKGPADKPFRPPTQKIYLVAR